MLESIKGSPTAAFLAALAVTWLVTPVVRTLALRAGAVARQDARRVHQGLIAQWGGLALFIGMLAAALLWRQPGPLDIRPLAPSPSAHDIAATAQTLHLTTTFFLCGLLILLLGMADDRFELKPWQKLSGQAIVTFVLWHGGVRVTTLPFSAGTQVLSDPVSLLLTLVWVLCICNGINFIDGVDGLAAGVCAIAAGSLCLIELNRAPWAAVVSAALCGASLGFLRHNFYPAKIFLGDAGSQLLGFWLAAIGLAAASKTAAATTLAIPILILGVPICDTLWAIARRTAAGVPPWHADRGHLHHRLLARGFSPVKTVTVLYGIGLLLGAVAVAVARR
jgi:UDP-GlcNAc:undecaprenyl-phosphate GlcNAc-1-phosphate transferase